APPPPAAAAAAPRPPAQPPAAPSTPPPPAAAPPQATAPPQTTAPPQVAAAPSGAPGAGQTVSPVPVATIRRIAYRGGTGQNGMAGAFTREGNNAWVESNSTGRTFRFNAISESDKEILLLDASREMQVWIDLLRRKWSWRQSVAEDWKGGLDILATVSDATT